MRYLLDTNVCVMYLNGRSNAVRDRLISTPIEDMVVCSVVKSELFYGAMRSNSPTKTLERQQEFLERFVSLPFGDESALLFGQIRARLASAGTPIGAYDLQISSKGLAHFKNKNRKLEYWLATENGSKFEGA
jgi:tRNA(fMet)-specific endonuclease VapC